MSPMVSFKGEPIPYRRSLEKRDARRQDDRLDPRSTGFAMWNPFD